MPQPKHSSRRVWFWLAIAIGAAIAGAVAGFLAFSPRPAADQAAEQLYRAELPDPAGQPVRFDALRGKTLVVNFWAPWCAPCVEEMPDLAALHQEYQGRNVEFVGIGIDSQSNIARFLEKVPVNYPLAVAGFAGTEMARGFGNAAGGLPYTVVIDPQGAVTLRKMGRISVEELRSALPAR
ncbi:TlpA disulfide reductase family protein [Cupriavidus sp. AU9028]|uniref:TlpA family protein disulfide reductase n=1 Tax=Cupriavidus sp. AU9028 TaxID=2871157 RepID=UPI001C97C02D|nr:TlpA disulfide reductase family protein [Cupriavidus sp. AU9028]MBY4897398.1 TlpA family protein disulfide reductase [Cupriavidus sp. AU9028]